MQSGDVAGGAGLWTVINLILSMALGGYVGSRLSGTHSHLDGELHGITVWAVAVLFSLLAFAHLFGDLIERGTATSGSCIPKKRMSRCMSSRPIWPSLST
jgi:hypothetical protein